MTSLQDLFVFKPLRWGLRRFMPQAQVDRAMEQLTPILLSYLPR